MNINTSNLSSRPNLNIENTFLNNLGKCVSAPRVCGIDEVGRGCLAGPVVACALVFNDYILRQFNCLMQNNQGDEDFLWLKEIDDSKKIPPKKREFLASKIMEHSVFAIDKATVREIDGINILRASLLAMQRAYLKLQQQILVHVILIDGKYVIELPLNSGISFTPEQKPIIKGDSQSLTIAAASIVAKVYRDAMMAQLAKEPGSQYYNWQHNAGYGTKYHKDMILKHGITIHHRKSFAPCKYINYKI